MYWKAEMSIKFYVNFLDQSGRMEIKFSIVLCWFSSIIYYEELYIIYTRACLQRSWIVNTTYKMLLFHITQID